MKKHTLMIITMMPNDVYSSYNVTRIEKKLYCPHIINRGIWLDVIVELFCTWVTPFLQKQNYKWIDDYKPELQKEISSKCIDFSQRESIEIYNKNGDIIGTMLSSLVQIRTHPSILSFICIVVSRSEIHNLNHPLKINTTKNQQNRRF